MNCKFKIKISSILSFLVLFSCCGIEYINILIPAFSKILFVLRVLILGVLALYNIQSKRRLSGEMKMISVFCAYIILVSMINHLDFLYILRSISVSYLVAYYIDLHRMGKKVYHIIHIWKNLLLILVIIDFVTMIFFPNGLYDADIYTLNWFLGYKTARFPFVLLLCVLEEIEARKKGCFLQCNMVYLLSLVTIVKSGATGAFLSFCFTALVLIISRQEHKGRNWKQKLIGAILDYRVIVPIYILITFLTILTGVSPTMAKFLEILGKDPTLTTRTYIWANAIELIKNRSILGYGYLTTNQYRELLGSVYFSSPHNMILSLLMIGGVVCMLLYLFILIGVWKKSKIGDVGFICTIGMLAMLFIGIASSSMLFTLSGFVIFTLASCERLLE